MDLKEISSDEFKDEINRLSDKFTEETKLKNIQLEQAHTELVTDSLTGIYNRAEDFTGHPL